MLERCDYTFTNIYTLYYTVISLINSIYYFSTYIFKYIPLTYNIKNRAPTRIAALWVNVKSQTKEIFRIVIRNQINHIRRFTSALISDTIPKSLIQKELNDRS